VMGTDSWHWEDLKETGNNYPAVYVSWNDAAKFCKKLTALERKSGKLPVKQTYRLPKEVKWEYACRAGTTRRLLEIVATRLANRWVQEHSGLTARMKELDRPGRHHETVPHSPVQAYDFRFRRALSKRSGTEAAEASVVGGADGIARGGDA